MMDFEIARDEKYAEKLNIINKGLMPMLYNLFTFGTDFTRDYFKAEIDELEKDLITISSESLMIGFGREQAKIWKESVEKPLKVELKTRDAVIEKLREELEKTIEDLKDINDYNGSTVMAEQRIKKATKVLFETKQMMKEG